MARSGGGLGCGCGALVGAVVVLLVVAVLFRGTLATWLTGRRLEAHGLTCTPLEVDVDLSWSTLTVAPTTCSTSSPDVRSVALARGATIDVSSEHVTAPEVALDLTLPMPELDARLLTGDAVPAALQRSLRAVAALARERLPALDIESLRLIPGSLNEASITLRNVRTQSEAGRVAAQIGASDARSLSIGPLELRAGLGETRVTATGAEVNLDGRLAIDLGVGPARMGDTVPFRIRASALDEAEAHYEMSIEPSALVANVRARLAEWIEHPPDGAGAVFDLLRQALPLGP